MRDKIAEIISEGQRYDCSSGQLADDVYFLIAPELEKARKWDRTLNAFWEFPEHNDIGRLLKEIAEISTDDPA
jgi:hypothetical protein